MQTTAALAQAGSRVPAPAAHLSLIRGFELRDGEDRVIPMALSAQRLVAFVALHDRPVRRLHTSGMLWTDATESRASSSLRSALWRTPAPGDRPLIEASNTHLWLHPDIQVDFRECVAQAMAILRPGTAESAVDWSPNTGTFADDLLPDWYEDWVLVERERYRQLRLHALETICSRLTDAGLFAQALVAGLAAVACEPLRESAQRQVIRAHLGEGNVGEALRQYRTYARLLGDELGAVPSAALDCLLGPALAGHIRPGRPVTGP